ncbi:hypothetical protein [Salipiger sp. CCB-MM3]|uniref:hypothetical protein n=1 Tax=Salipiger sp. CCB-MM3 TaxID=1792508 RepID=UPI0012F8B608|nr:hypothetical protein [Salipiger sp. CCB-MM3]
MSVRVSKKVKGGNISVGSGGNHAKVGGKVGSVNVGKKGVTARVKIPGTGISVNKKIK